YQSRRRASSRRFAARSAGRGCCRREPVAGAHRQRREDRSAPRFTGKHAGSRKPHGRCRVAGILVMAWFRSLIYLLFLIITVIPYAVACTLCAPLPQRVRYRFTVGWPRLAVWGARTI